MMMRCSFVKLSLLALVLGWVLVTVYARPSLAGESAVTIDASAPGAPLNHFWEQMFGSGRAILSLRESYRNDLRQVKKATDFRYVRFHAIFHDEVGVYDEDDAGKPIYNFTYVDQIYDGLLANGVRPFVELSFMPRKLALRTEDVHPFWYKQLVSPPKDYARWEALIRAFAEHLVARYGADEVAQWYFEVWNEPNIDFWTGDPKFETYLELYAHTARALKAVSPRLRVGGPSTAAADWVDRFLERVLAAGVPIDFVSSHGYADDTPENLFHSPEDVPMDERVCRAIRKVRGQIQASGRPDLPLLWTEWSVPSFGALNARDNVYVGAALAEDIRQCLGLVDMMSWWTFSDVFEESGVRSQPFDGGFGLMAAGGIRKPSYYAFELLHGLGDTVIESEAPGVLATRRPDGAVVVAAWNLLDLDRSGGTSVRKVLRFVGVKPDAVVSIRRLDESHGNTQAVYRAMGSPRYPTPAEAARMNQLSASGEPERAALMGGELAVEIPVNGLVLIEVGAGERVRY